MCWGRGVVQSPLDTRYPRRWSLGSQRDSLFSKRSEAASPKELRRESTPHPVSVRGKESTVVPPAPCRAQDHATARDLSL